MVDKKFHEHNFATFVGVHAISQSPYRVINNQEVAIQLKPQIFVAFYRHNRNRFRRFLYRIE